MTGEKGLRVRGLLLASALLVPMLALSQQPPDSSSTQDPSSTNPPAQTPAQDPSSVPTQNQPNPAGGSQGLFARALNSANPLSGQNGPLQWGWVSIRSLSYLQYFGNVTVNNPGMPASNEDLNASQFSAAIVIDHTFSSLHLLHFTVQYTPSLFVTEGHVYTNALNQSAGLDTAFQLDPRWSLELSDRFSYLGSQRYYSGLSLDANYSLGSVQQNSFLNGPGTVIYNTLGATFTYLWSPVTTVSFTPTFSYQDATGSVSSTENLSAFYGGGRVNVSHSISASQTIGVSYMGQYAAYSNTSTTAGPQVGGLQQDAMFTYGQQLGASLRFNVGLGWAGNSGSDSQAGLAASAGITKSIQRMAFAFNYYRGHQFNGYVASGTSNRVDLVHTIHWGQRFSTSTSGAYFKTSGGSSQQQSGTYGTEQFNLALARTISATASISYTNQTGDGVYVQSRHSLLGTVGLVWSTQSQPPR